MTRAVRVAMTASVNTEKSTESVQINSAIAKIKIRMTINPKAFFADGNVKTSISQEGSMEL